MKPGREFSREDVSRSKDHHVPSSAVRARNAAGIQKGIKGYTASHSQQEQFVNSLVKAIVTGNTPFSFVENEHLVSACKSIGVALPSRRLLAQKYVPALADQACMSKLQALSKMPIVDASSDGWGSKYSKGGESLNNVMVLTPDHAYFHDAVNVSGLCKNYEGIKQFIISSSTILLERRMRPCNALQAG